MKKQDIIENNQNKKIPLPFLRWAGGKRWLINNIKKIIPTDFNNYYEPFLGAGSLFFSLKPNKAYLSDINEELILTYFGIKKNYRAVTKYLNQYKNNKTNYYRIRDSSPKSDYEKAARLIYLNKTCWNGLYRVNNNGKFNVPYGFKKNISIYDVNNLKIVSDSLKNVELKNCDFEVSLKNCKKKDLIYIDPPYTVAHQNNGFIKYNAKIFSWKDQERLAKVVNQLNEEGCYIILSNSYHESLIKLYKNFNLQKYSRKSLISANADSRKKIYELLVTNFES